MSHKTTAKKRVTKRARFFSKTSGTGKQLLILTVTGGGRRAGGTQKTDNEDV